MPKKNDPSQQERPGSSREVVGPETGKPEIGQPEVGKPLIGKPGGSALTNDGLDSQ